LHERKVVGSQFVVARRNATALLDPVEETLASVAVAVEIRAEADRIVAISFWGDVGPSASHRGYGLCPIARFVMCILRSAHFYRISVMTHEEMLNFYSAPGIFTEIDGFKSALEPLQNDVASVVKFVQGLLVHEAFSPAYGLSISPQRAEEKQIHAARRILVQATQLDGSRLTQTRTAAKRVVGVCRHFVTLFTAVLRSRGIPCRARCGFANYFTKSKHVDHWVAEYWKEESARWVLVDVQVDDLQRTMFGIDFDTLDTPRDRFLVGGDAWQACRNGADPMNFGIAGTPIWGLLEVYGDIFQDLAALQKIELLPWGWYGLAKDKSGMDETNLIDRLASVSSRADGSALDELRELLAQDSRLQVPQEMVTAIAAKETELLS
jgi:hypothetical protein